MEDLIDPWASFSLDYDKLVNQFGIGKVSDIINEINNPQRLMQRGVIFGHREFNEINNLIENPNVMENLTSNTVIGLERYNAEHIIEKWKSILNELTK